MALPRPGDPAPAAPPPSFSTLAEREKRQREQYRERSKAGFDAAMAASEHEMTEQIRAESPNYGDMEPDPGSAFDQPDMSDLPGPDVYGTAAWGAEYRRRMERQISDTFTSAIRAEESQRRSSGHPESYAPSGDAGGGEAWGPDLIAEALRAEGRR
jgi:hypothetical protein